MEKRTVSAPTRRGMSVSDLILVAVLLAAGAVLKYFAGSIINIAGMKPNFIIAMYCLAILLIRPRFYESVIIGLLAGAVCQLFPGSPYINLISEVCGAAVMGLMIKLPMMQPGRKLINTLGHRRCHVRLDCRQRQRLHYLPLHLHESGRLVDGCLCANRSLHGGV